MSTPLATTESAVMQQRNIDLQGTGDALAGWRDSGAGEMGAGTSGYSGFAARSHFEHGTGELTRDGRLVAERKTDCEINRDALARAIALAQALSEEDPDEALLAKEALLVACGEFWESVARDTRQRKAVLAMIEGTLSQLEWNTEGLRQIIVEALQDFGAPTVTNAHVSVLRRRLVSVGYDPLAFLGEVANE